MAGRTRIPRCPVCGALLTTDRTIDERWVRRQPGPDLWVYRLACAGCLSIARIERPEVSALSRAEPTAAVVDIAGAVTARLLERMERAGSPKERAALFDEVAAHAEERFLLRIPEVLARLRGLFGRPVRLREDLLVVWPLVGPSSRPSGRIHLFSASKPMPPDPFVSADGTTMIPDSVVRDGSMEITLRAGCELDVLGVEEGSLLLARPASGPAAELLGAVDHLVGWPDFVVPQTSDEG